MVDFANVLRHLESRQQVRNFAILAINLLCLYHDSQILGMAVLAAAQHVDILDTSRHRQFAGVSYR